MNPFEPDPPPKPVPPAPPRPEHLLPPAPGGRPAGPPMTPMMDFFARRVEALERELAVERERAAAAQAQLGRQDALRGEVDAHLKALSEQLRREKNEREGEDARIHARGRIESLERRLDEMNATFAQLLKEAVARRDAAPDLPAGASEAVTLELASFRRTVKDIAEQVARWRDEMKDLPRLVPEVEAVAARIPEDEKRFEEHIARRLDEFSARVAATLSEWERRQELELRKQEERAQEISRERAALGRMWEEQGHAIRQEFLKERIARETALSDQIASLAKRLDAAAREQKDSAAAGAAVREGLDQVLAHLRATPKAKDEVISELEGEKAELVATLRRRQEDLRRFVEERRAVEKSLGDSLMTLTAEVERARGETREAAARESEALRALEALRSRLEMLERSVSERDARLLSVAAERDELTRALVAEAEKVRLGVAERAAADERWHQRLLDAQRRVEEEAAKSAGEAATAADLRAKVAALSEHMARALQERDAIVARFADWERERQRLLDALKQKDGMISMLSSVFQGSLKKP